MDLNDPTTVALLAAEALAAYGRDYALYGGLLTADVEGRWTAVQRMV